MKAVKPQIAHKAQKIFFNTLQFLRQVMKNIFTSACQVFQTTMCNVCNPMKIILTGSPCRFKIVMKPIRAVRFSECQVYS